MTVVPPLPTHDMQKPVVVVFGGDNCDKAGMNHSSAVYAVAASHHQHHHNHHHQNQQVGALGFDSAKLSYWKIFKFLKPRRNNIRVIETLSISGAMPLDSPPPSKQCLYRRKSRSPKG